MRKILSISAGSTCASSSASSTQASMRLRSGASQLSKSSRVKGIFSAAKMRPMLRERWTPAQMAFGLLQRFISTAEMIVQAGTNRIVGMGVSKCGCSVDFAEAKRIAAKIEILILGFHGP